MQRLLVGILLLFIGLSTASAQELPPLEKITPENVGQLTEIATLGYGMIRDVEWSPDGETIGIVSTYLGSHLYRFGQRDSTPVPLVQALIQNIYFSPDGRWVVSRSYYDDTFFLNTADGRYCGVWHGSFKQFSPDSTALAYLAPDGTLRRLTLTDGSETLMISGLPIDPDAHWWGEAPLWLSPQWTYQAELSSDGRIHLSEHETGNEKLTVRGERIVGFSDDETYIAVTNGKYVYIWNIQTGERQSRFRSDMEFAEIVSVVFSPDNRYIIAHITDFNVYYELHDLRTGASIPFPYYYDVGPNGMIFNQDGSGVIWTDYSSVVQWNIETQIRQNLWAGQGYALRTILNSDGRRIISYGPDGWQIIDLMTGDVLGRGRGSYSGQVGRLAFNTDGTKLYSESFNGVPQLWNIQTGSETTEQEQPALVFRWKEILATPNESNLLLSQSAVELRPHISWTRGSVPNSTETFLLTEPSDLVATLSPYSAYNDTFTFNADDTRIAIYQTRTSSIYVFDTSSQRLLAVLDYYGLHFVQVVFSPDDRLLVASGANGLVRVWDTEQFNTLADFNAPVGVNSLAFNPDGTLLVLGGSDGTIRLWGVPE